MSRDKQGFWLVRHALVLVFALWAVPALAAPVDVMLVGDSLTRGYDPYGDGDGIDGDGEINGGWRAPLYVNALEAGFDLNYFGREDTGPSHVDVNGQSVPFDGQHEGYNGARIDTTITSASGAHSILDRLPAMFDANNGGTDPAALDYVFLSVGVNDLLDSDDGMGYDSTDSRYTPNRMNNLIQQVRNTLDAAGNYTAKLMVSNVLPVRDEFTAFSGVTEPFGDELNQVINAYNSAFADFFSGAGEHLTLSEVYMLDGHSIINADREAYIHDYNSSDGKPDFLHLTQAGNQALADYYMTAIPEPGTGALLLLAAGTGLLVCRPRQRRGMGALSS